MSAVSKQNYRTGKIIYIANPIGSGETSTQPSTIGMRFTMKMKW
jgi:hypothetical protein